MTETNGRESSQINLINTRTFWLIIELHTAQVCDAMNLLYPNVSSSTSVNLFLIQRKQFYGDPISLIYYCDALR